MNVRASTSSKKVHPLDHPATIDDLHRKSHCDRSWSQQHISCLKLFIGTWNMNGKVPKSRIFPFTELSLPPTTPGDDSKPHISPSDKNTWPYNIIAIGCQEARHTPKFKRWLDTCISLYENEGYKLVKVVKLGSLSLVVLVVWWMMKGLRITTGTATKNFFNRLFGNKGATYVSLHLANGQSFLFVNCHFSAHQEKVSERRKDYSKLSSLISQRFPNRDKGIQDQFDGLFWFGDLNYRVNGTRTMVNHWIERKERDVMLSNDQLGQEMTLGHVLNGFTEHPIHFPPTYKYNILPPWPSCFRAKRNQVDTESEPLIPEEQPYDTSIKWRVPSWTDRVLFANRKEGRVACQKYDCEMGAMESDHKPVYAIFDVNI
ncbi:inositol polyphosphate 5-phosphatase [Podochytrium sp. JEL0797]|nr:inositol polyphosphate 5-phosphatase [Podochytrium sp. JEL0797]